MKVSVVKVGLGCEGVRRVGWMCAGVCMSVRVGWGCEGMCRCVQVCAGCEGGVGVCSCMQRHGKAIRYMLSDNSKN